MSFGEVLWWIEKHGGLVVPSRSLEKLVGIDAREALHAAGIVVGAPAAATWRCDLRGCAGREIRASHDGAARPLVAVCSQAPGACEAVELGFDDVAQKEISVEALVRVVCGLLGGAEVDGRAAARVGERRGIGESRVPVLVSSVAGAGAERDVFWVGSPRDVDLAGFCGRRERVARGTLVVVPTGRHVGLEVASRYAHGEKVEVLALEDVLVVREGKLALVGGGAAAAAVLREERGRVGRRAVTGSLRSSA